MRAKSYYLIIIFSLSALYSICGNANVDNGYIPEFKYATLQSCDKVFHKLENGCSDMICQDILVDAWTECWKRSMNSKLNQRLLKLKNSNITKFHLEMDIQKNFNSATEKLCGKDCGSGGTMKSIPYNFCRADAYKYRTMQAIQINKNQLSIPIKGYLTLSKSHKGKTKDTQYYGIFSSWLCKMPNVVWKGGNPPADCQKKVFIELNSLEFTDDVCNLS